jgi:hypothetical protein
LNKFRLIALVFTVLQLSCKESNSNKEVVKKQDKLEFKSNVAFKPFKIEKLNKSVNDSVVKHWSEYEQILAQIEFLNQGDVSFFISEAKTINGTLDTLKLKQPKCFSNNAIDSRLMALDVQVNILNQNFILDNISDEVKIQSIKEVIGAVSNLNYQMNKKFEFDEFYNSTLKENL